MARRLLLALLTLTVALSIAVGDSRAATIPFGATPATNAKLGPRSYFSFTLDPGETASDGIVLSNQSAKSETLEIGEAVGATATNSGYAYVGAYGPCREEACWLHGLPSEVTLGPNQSKTVKFTVAVPANAPRQQYLAGIVIRSTTKPAATNLGTKKGVGAHAVVIPEISIGVAITTGPVSTLTRKLVILDVKSDKSGGTPSIIVREANEGQTFVSAVGTAVCVHGVNRFAYPVVSRTILPGDQASLSVFVPGIPTGSLLSCQVSLGYKSHDAVPAAWRGAVHMPSTKPAKVVETAPGVFGTVPKPSVPTWAIALIVAGGIAVLALLVVIVILLRRRPSSAT